MKDLSEKMEKVYKRFIRKKIQRTNIAKSFYDILPV